MDADTEKYPLLLWNLVQTISLSGSTVDNQAKRRQDAKTRFNRLAQGQSEAIGAFYERYEVEQRALVSAGAVIGDAAEQAMDFLSKIDKRRYAGLLADLENSFSLGRDEYLVTVVVAAYQLALNRRDSHTSYGVAIDTRDVLTTATDGNDKHGKKKNSKDKSKNCKGKSIKTELKPAAGEDAESNDGLECFFCHKKGHIKSECRLLEKAKKELQKMGLVAVTTIEEEDIGTSFSVHEDDAVKEHYALAVNSFGQYDILCDSQSDVHISKEASLFSNIRAADRPLRVAGMGVCPNHGLSLVRQDRD